MFTSFRSKIFLISFCFFITLLTLYSNLPVHAQSDDREMMSRVSIQSEDAKELLQKAARRERKGYPNEATKLYLKLMKEFDDATIKKSKNLYVDVREFVRQKMSGWSEERLNWFREYTQGDAQSLISRARKTNEHQFLLRAAELYFFTEAGRKAAREIARRNFKEGNFGGAIYWWKQLLKYHPDPGVSEFDLKFRLLMAYRSSGEVRSFQKLKKEFKKKLNGLTESKRERIERFLSSPETTGDSGDDVLTDWPRPGGNSRGQGRVTSELERYKQGESKTSHLGNLVLLWQFPSRLESDSRSSKNLEQLIRTGDTGSRLKMDQDVLPGEGYCPLQPIVYRDKLYINDGSGVFVFEIGGKTDLVTDADNRLLYRYPDEDRHDRFDTQRVKNLYEKKLGLKSLAAKEGAIYYTVDNKLYKRSETLEQTLFKKKDAISPPKVRGEQLKFNGTPLVTENGIFVPMVRSYREQEIEIYLGCFSRATGDLKWNRLLGGAFDLPSNQRNRNQQTLRRYSQLLSEDNQIYLSSNMGLFASVHEVSGNVKWVHDYSEYGIRNLQNKQEPNSDWTPDSSSTRGMETPVIDNGIVYVMPWDSPMLLGFDLKTGQKVFSQRAPKAERFYEIGKAKIDGEPKPFAFYFGQNPENNQKFGPSRGLVALPLHLPSKKRQRRRRFTSFTEMGSYVPSHSPGKQKLLFGGDKKIKSINRSNLMLHYVQKWPGGSTAPPHRLVSIGERTVIVGPAGVAVLTTVDSLLKKIMSAERITLESVRTPLQILARNRQFRSIVQVLEKLLSSNRLDQNKRKAIRELYGKILLKTVDRARQNEEWNVIPALARKALKRISPGTSLYFKVFGQLDSVLFHQKKYEELISLYKTLWKKYLKKRDDVSNRMIEIHERRSDSGVYRVSMDQFISTRFEQLRQVKPELLKKVPQSFLNRYLIDERSSQKSSDHRENSGGDENKSGTSSEAEHQFSSKDKTKALDPVESVLSKGWASLMTSDSGRFSNAVQFVQQRRLHSLARELIDELETREHETFTIQEKKVNGKQLKKQLSKTLSDQGSEKRSSGMSGDESYSSLQWLFDKKPDFWKGADRDGIAQPGIPVVYGGEGVQNRSGPIQIKEISQAVIKIYDPCDKMPRRASFKSKLQPFSSGRYVVRTDFTRAGQLLLLVEDRKRQSTDVLLFGPAEKQKSLEVHRSFYLPVENVREVRLSPRRLFVHRSKPKGDQQNNSMDVLEAYSRSRDHRRLWARNVGSRRRLVWFAPSWKPDQELFVLFQNFQERTTAGSKSPDETEPIRNARSEIKTFFRSPPRPDAINFFRGLGSRRSDTIFAKLHQGSGSVLSTLHLDSPRSLVIGGEDPSGVLIPGTRGRTHLVGFDANLVRKRWEVTLNERRDDFVLLRQQDTFYVLRHAGDSLKHSSTYRPDTPAPLVYHHPKGFVLEKGSGKNPELFNINLSNIRNGKPVMMVPTEEPERLFVIRPPVEEKDKNGLKNWERLWHVEPEKKKPYSEFKIRWTGNFMSLSDQKPGRVYAHRGPADVLVLLHNFRKNKNHWRAQVFDSKQGRVLWQSSRPSSPDHQKFSFPVPEGIVPRYVGGQCAIGFRWGPHLFEVTRTK